MAQVVRFDRVGIGGKVRNRRRTTNGGVELDCFFSRTGVFRYQRQDGKPVREYRSPEEVFAPQSVETLQHIAVTRDHPPNGEMVDEHNWNKYAIGIVTTKGDRVTDPATGIEYLAGKLLLTDAQAIKDADEGKLVELSLGYWCDLDWTPGVDPKGDAYDCLQREIIQNHAATGGENYGRAGRDCKMHTDRDDVDGYAFDGKEGRADSEGTPAMEYVYINGQKYVKGSNEHLDALEKMHRDTLGEVNGKLAAAVTNEAAAKKDAAELVQLRAEKEARVRENIFAHALKLGVKCDAKALATTPAIEIIKQVLSQKGYTAAIEGQDDSFIMGYFMALNPAAASSTSTAIDPGGATGGAPVIGTDARTAYQRIDANGKPEGEGQRTSRIDSLAKSLAGAHSAHQDNVYKVQQPKN